MQPQYLVVAHLMKPHGLAGEIEVLSLTDFPERFTEGLIVYPSPPIAGVNSLTIKTVDIKPKNLLMTFENIDSREEAERLAGRDLLVPIDEAAPLPEGDFWVHDIVGMEVITTGGESLGHVDEVLRTGSNDVYLVKGEHEYLIPATKEVVKDVSLTDRRIVIEPIPGLLE